MPKMKKSILLLSVFAIMLFFSMSAYALDYTISQHSITIQINTDGKDTVVEKFIITFPNESAKKVFRENSLVLGTNIDNWKQLNKAFTPSLGESTQNKKIAYTEGEPNYLQMSYELTQPLMAVGKEATMLTEYDLKVNYFNGFYGSGLWIIPENTSISIETPPGAEIRTTVEPQADITSNGTRKVITWQGYKSANKLALSYVVWKKIEPVIDLNATTNFLFKTQEGIILLLIVCLILAAIVWQRKTINKQIEEFVEKYSVIKED